MPIQYPATIELSDLDGKNGLKINGIAVDDRSGRYVNQAGDVNGDGVGDVIIGAYFADPNGSKSGQSYVVFGDTSIGSTATLELSDLNGINGFMLNGGNTDYQSGVSVATAGDVNNDGIDDFIIGAWGADPNGINSGQSYVVFGGSDVGSSGTVELSSLNGANGFKLSGIAMYDSSGRSVSSGDINGDGIDDLIISSPYVDVNGSDTGQSYIVFGGSSVGSTGIIELSNLNGVIGFRLNGITSGDRSGRAVSQLGDINGDGIGDLIIGAFLADPNGASSGQSYVIFGGSCVGSAGTIELSDINGTNGFKLNGIMLGDQSGFSLSYAGDINNDGFNDLIIGAYKASPNGVQSGQSYIVFGGVSVGSSGVFELSDLNGANGFKLNGIASNDQSGISVSSVADMNADGVDDLLIGAFDPIVTESGQSYVIFGGSDVGSSGTVELSDLNGTTGFSLNGIAPNDRNGRSVSQAGDINGDGIGDLIIGAYFASPNGLYSGQSYVIFGETLAVVNNQLSINEGQNVAVSSASLSAKNTWTDDNTLIFQPFNVTHGQFELAIDPNVAITSFTQQQIIDLQIRFRHDGSEFPPNYGMGVANTAGVVRTPEPAMITYSSNNTPPQIIENRLTLSEGETVLITANDIAVTDPDNNPGNLLLTVSQVKQGHFALMQTPTMAITQFVQNQITQGNIVFVHDGSEQSPSFDLSVNDGSLTVGPNRADIFFTPVNDVPVLETNNLNINQGQRLIINSGNLRATDPDTQLFDLVFQISGIKHGQFEQFFNPGVAINEFRQQTVFDGGIRFAHDGSQFPPNYNVTVSDGTATSLPGKVTVNFGLSKGNVVVSQKSNTVRNAVIGATVSGFVGLLFLALKIYIKKKTDKQMQKALAGEGDGVEGQQAVYFRNVISPIANKIFKRIKIRGFTGLSDKKLEAYLDAVARIVAECHEKGVPVDNLAAMNARNQRALIDEIAKHTKQTLVPESSLLSSVTGFFKAQTNPEAMELAAPMIASLVKASWNATQERARGYSQAQGIEMTSLGGTSTIDTSRDNPIFGRTMSQTSLVGADAGVGVGVGAVMTTSTQDVPAKEYNVAELLAGFREEFRTEVQGLKEYNQQLEAKNQVLQDRIEQLEGKQILPPPLPRP